MPLKRKLIKVGDSRAVVIPADWLKYHEDKTGQQIVDVFLEINHVITLAVDDNESSGQEISPKK